MKRWKTETKIRQLRQMMVSVFVLTIILILPILGIWQWTNGLDLLKTNKASALPTFTARPVDKSSFPNVFEEPLITVTFDDGWETTYTVAVAQRPTKTLPR